MNDGDQKNFRISVAGRCFSVHTLHPDAFSLCRDYLTYLPPEGEIRITESDIAAERPEMIRQGHARDDDGYLETLALHRKLSEAMLSFDTFLMHGAVVSYGGNAYMFSADSGVGKTTHLRKWLAEAEGAFPVNGDKPLIRITGSRAIACGTPWCGKEQIGKNTMAPLRAIVLMERAEENRIGEISFGRAFPDLLRQTHRPADESAMKKTLALLSALYGRVSFWRFACNNLSEDCFRTSFEALTGHIA